MVKAKGQKKGINILGLVIFRSEESQKDNKTCTCYISETYIILTIHQPRNKSKSLSTFEYKMNTNF